MRYHGKSVGVLVALVGLVLPAAGAFAHCDGLDGPVVKAAREALESGNVNPALAWVQIGGEAEVKASFEKTLAVRRLGADARELADRYFFETLVRVHRAGEDEPFTGLKPAGRDLDPAIPAADSATESGSSERVVQLITEAVRHGLESRLAAASSAKAQAAGDVNDVEKGRRYVQAYVAFLHYVERLYAAAAAPASEGHAPAPSHAATPDHAPNRAHEAETTTAGHAERP